MNSLCEWRWTGKDGWQNDLAKEKDGGCELTTSPPIDSVLIHIQPLLSHIALYVLKVHASVCKMLDTFFGIRHNENISPVSDFKLLLFAAYPFALTVNWIKQNDDDR